MAVSRELNAIQMLVEIYSLSELAAHVIGVDPLQNTLPRINDLPRLYLAFTACNLTYYLSYLVVTELENARWKVALTRFLRIRQ
jgi:hypothetical protein